MGRNNKLSSQFTTTKRGRTQNIFFTFAIEVLKSQKRQPSALLGLGMKGAHNRLPSKWASISARGGRSWPASKCPIWLRCRIRGSPLIVNLSLKFWYYMFLKIRIWKFFAEIWFWQYHFENQEGIRGGLYTCFSMVVESFSENCSGVEFSSAHPWKPVVTAKGFPPGKSVPSPHLPQCTKRHWPIQSFLSLSTSQAQLR